MQLLGGTVDCAGLGDRTEVMQVLEVEDGRNLESIIWNNSSIKIEFNC